MLRIRIGKRMISLFIIIIVLVLIKIVWVSCAIGGHGSFDNERKRLSVEQTILPQRFVQLHSYYLMKCQVVLVNSSKGNGPSIAVR